MKYFKVSLSVLVTYLVILSPSFAFSLNNYYISGALGNFQANFNFLDKDRSDAIKQDIAESIQQNAYDVGLAIGYTQEICQYHIGFEFAGHYVTGSARYRSGAATAAFKDKMKIHYYLDALFVPGISITDSLIAYLKLGLSLARIEDTLSSPAGFLPVYTSYHSQSNEFGFVGGLGVKQRITPNIFIYAEYLYHDYQTAQFERFMNFSAHYSHQADASNNVVALGVSYFI